ncbi:hypothetical protein JA1_003130 [Spathaspora sp. JA1]|nr:hypothetical protein JA1_003130 [Spathaspora sp. JA1]
MANTQGYDYWSFHVQKPPIPTFCQVEGTNFILTVAFDQIELKDLDDRKAEATIISKSNIDYISSIDSCASTLNVVSTTGNQVILTDISVGEEIMRYERKLKTGKLRDCKFLSKDLVATCGDMILHLADIRESPHSSNVLSSDRQPRQTWLYPTQGKSSLTSIGYSDPYITVCSYSGKCHTLDLRNQQFISSTISKDVLMSVEQFPNDLSVSFDQQGFIRLYDVKKDSFLLEAKGLSQLPRRFINCHYIPERSIIINGSEEGLVYAWFLNEEKSRFTAAARYEVPGREAGSKSKENTVNHVDYVQGTNRLVASSGDGKIHVWDNVFK